MRALLPAVLLIGLVACKQSKERLVIRMKGSESMHEPFNAIREDFEMQQDSLTMSLDGGGSRIGLMAIKNEEVDIGLSSYRFDIDSLFGEGHDVAEHLVAFDGIVLINNEQNPINQLTNEEIWGIYSGHYTDWSQLGGKRGKIRPIVRDQNSGTQKFFIEHYGVDSITAHATVAQENEEIVSMVLEDPNGIGFIGYAYVTLNVKDISVPSMKTRGDTSFVYPSFSSIQQGAYPLKRSLMIYCKQEPSAAVGAFLSYLNSPRGQDVLEKNGLISTSKVELVTELYQESAVAK